MTKHTSEPWHVVIDAAGDVFIAGPDGEFIADLPFHDDETRSAPETDAERMVACVNALAGIPNPAAVADVVEAATKLLEAAERHIFGDECLAERDALRAALAKLGDGL